MEKWEGLVLTFLTLSQEVVKGLTRHFLLAGLIGYFDAWQLSLSSLFVACHQIRI